MTSPEPQKVLKELGLSTNEIKIYMALLPIGSAPASVLGKRTKLPRTTAREVCMQLTDKSLFTRSEKGQSFIFTVEPPSTLMHLLEQEKELTRHKEAQVNTILGQLNLMHNPNTLLPKVRFYEGQEGMIQLYEEILKLKKDVDSFEDSGEKDEYIHDYAQSYIQRRIKNKMFNRVICPDTNKINPTSKKELRETRKIDSKKYPFSFDIKICDNLVGIFSFDKDTPVAISIVNKDIAKNFRLLFELVWNQLKR